jgi:hypothetical protein
MPGNPLVRFDEGRVGRTEGVALSPTLPSLREYPIKADRRANISPRQVAQDAKFLLLSDLFSWRSLRLCVFA